MLLLVGEHAALLEGLSQSLAVLGFRPRVAQTLTEARDLALSRPPLVVVVHRDMAMIASADAIGLTLAPGGALIVYTTSPARASSLPIALQRAVLADLTLPLERHRLTALVQHVDERARLTGRSFRVTPPGRPVAES